MFWFGFECSTREQNWELAESSKENKDIIMEYLSGEQSRRFRYMIGVIDEHDLECHMKHRQEELEKIK
jgi:hypothetical protein